MINAIPAALPPSVYSFNNFCNRAVQAPKTNLPTPPANNNRDTVSLSSNTGRNPQHPLLLMSDYDGTLHRIITNFKDSFLESQELDTIRRVANQPDIFFSIVSGRPMPQLLQIFAPLAGTPMFLVGSHGGEIYDLQNGTYLKRVSETHKRIADNIENDLQTRGVFNLPGIELEAKDGCFTIHYDQADPKAVMLTRQQIADTLKTHPDYQREFTTRNGKNVIEVLPKEFNKGQAVLNILPYASQRLGRNVPIDTAYAGDDISDYDAMKVVHQLGGDTLLVSETPKHETDGFVSQRVPSCQSVFQYFRTTIQKHIRFG